MWCVVDRTLPPLGLGTKCRCVKSRLFLVDHEADHDVARRVDVPLDARLAVGAREVLLDVRVGVVEAAKGAGPRGRFLGAVADLAVAPETPVLGLVLQDRAKALVVPGFRDRVLLLLLAVPELGEDHELVVAQEVEGEKLVQVMHLFPQLEPLGRAERRQPAPFGPLAGLHARLDDGEVVQAPLEVPVVPLAPLNHGPVRGETRDKAPSAGVQGDSLDPFRPRVCVVAGPHDRAKPGLGSRVEGGPALEHGRARRRLGGLLERL